MAWRFNGGRGAVTCDDCDIIIDENLSIDDYKKHWTDDEDLCISCKDRRKKKKKK